MLQIAATLMDKQRKVSWSNGIKNKLYVEKPHTDTHTQLFVEKCVLRCNSVATVKHGGGSIMVRVWDFLFVFAARTTDALYKAEL